ncbi:MAG: hypothetical protein U0324_26725 [Polyangiales bacterium]
MRLRPLLLLSLLAAFTGAGCSFPTDDFRLGGDAAADVRRDAAPDTTAPPDATPDATPDAAPDAPPPPDAAPDAPPPDVAPDAPPPTDGGGCNSATECSGARQCCQGACVDTATSTAHCGRCGAVCDPPNGDPACAAGACGVARCDMGFGNCDTNAANGCESTLATDPMNCGGCGTRCNAPPNAAASCAGGRCAFACNPGFADCNLNPADGCEEDLRTSPRACGACGSACTGGAGTTSTCVMGSCESQCTAGSADCDMDPSNGCEVNTRTSLANCGGCGLACSFPNAGATCASGVCTRAACNAGFGDCDGNAANGCESDVASSTANCGSCGRACPAGQACRAGACLSTCTPAPLMQCGAACVDTSASVANCGSCGRVCSFPNATAECRTGTCALAACTPGFGDCNASAGCETNLNTDVNNCGGCGVACGRTNGTPTCAAGVCGVTCNPGFSNCDGDPTDGCETATGTDVRNCGTCGRTCSLPNASATCAAGNCAVGTCTRGYANCDMNAATGCEVSLLDDESNCGACGSACLRGNFCVNGACTPCAPPRVMCSLRCVDTQTDTANCGACGRACGAGQQCAAGRCFYPAPANDLCAGATDINLAAGPRVTLSATTLGATHNVNSPCDAVGGGDVFFRFVLTRRELVYADTFGATWDTKLFFTNSTCTTPLTTQVTGDLVCDDNLGAACTTGGTASQVYTILAPGTYFLVLSSGASSGATAIRFEHIPVGTGATISLPRGAALTRAGATSGTTGSISQSCGGAGPELTYWWVTCPEQAAGTFSASTCARATWNTLLSVVNGSGTGNVCVNDSCGIQSSVVTTIPAGSGAHVLMIDGYNNGTDAVSGSYSLLYTRP